MGTRFVTIYNRFLNKITDDMYLELTPQDTLKDLQNLLIDGIPGFEFPRKNLYDYTLRTVLVEEEKISPEDFVLGLYWHNLDSPFHKEDELDIMDISYTPTWNNMQLTIDDDSVWIDLEELLKSEEEGYEAPKLYVVERSMFNVDLTEEEINILALLMKQGWVQRQVTSIENTRMKYSGSDFKMTSQANHLSKLLNLLAESQRDSFHMQRLYKRRKISSNGTYETTWTQFGQGVYNNYDRKTWRRYS